MRTGNLGLGLLLTVFVQQALSQAPFTNPIIYEDFADNDVFVGPDGHYYLSASNMHFSPGAPLLRSADLANWEMIGHSVPTLDFSDDRYNLVSSQAYRRGTWASTMRYRASNKTWYWIGCIDFWKSYTYTASSPTGPWKQAAVVYGTCYYDCGLFIDDDDTMYVVHGNDKINMTQLAPDGLSAVKTQQVFSSPSGTSSIEGNRMYKRNGLYYVLDDYPSGQSTYIWKSTSPWGPWTSKLLQQGVQSPVASGGTPHQGSLVKTSLGDWYFVSFTWAYPNGRMPVIAPITWGADDYPILTLVNNAWGKNYPNALPIKTTASWTGTDNFAGTSLGVAWEWNHNPDVTKYSVNNGITLSTATVTDDLYRARNTLTHRVHGGLPRATILLDFTTMADGDRCGLSAFRDWTAYIGISRSGSDYSLIMQDGLTLNSTTWDTSSLGTTVTSTPVIKGKIWLRGDMDARSAGNKQVTFSYSTDGSTFKTFGRNYTLNTDWAIFEGYRWGIFNYATKALGGSIAVLSFSQSDLS
ncbi:glycosyl hydrolase [Halenospora varia]|nr:glycosyl hydrolase [Halenospora varia]